MNGAEAVQNILTAGMTLTAAVLCLVALRAYRHTGSQKVGFILLGFALFLIKGIILSVGLFTTATWGEALLPWSIAFDMAILLLFYAAILKRSAG